MAIRIEQMVALAPRTTLVVGGAARYFVAAQSEAEVVEALWWARRCTADVMVLGGGSNSLIADKGFDGLVLQPAILGRRVIADDDTLSIEVGAGETWDDFVAWSVDQGLCGIEALSGIPGWVGAAPMQNIGAYGQEIASVVEAVKVVTRTRGEPCWLPAKELGFAYRTSAFKGVWRDRYIITAVRLRLHRGRPAPARYAELAKLLGGDADHPDAVRQEGLQTHLCDLVAGARLDAVVAELRRQRDWSGLCLLEDLRDPDSDHTWLWELASASGDCLPALATDGYSGNHHRWISSPDRPAHCQTYNHLHCLAFSHASILLQQYL